MSKKPHRSEYEKHWLSETDIASDPFVQLSRWWQEAMDAGLDCLDGASLATVDQDLSADCRIILIKSFDERGVVFFTNYDSNKSEQLAQNPRACLLLFWPRLERQIRLRGPAQKTSREESIEYFKSRPRGAQLGAWASEQSRRLKGREELESHFHEMEKRFSTGTVPCPPNWGGFRLVPTYFEFWQGRKDRLHDRLAYELHENSWRIFRLAP